MWTKTADTKRAFLKHTAQTLRLIADQLEGGAMEPGDTDGIADELDQIASDVRQINS